ncbi:MAG TPA: PAS domain S-box protein [Trichocoleus sp.]
MTIGSSLTILILQDELETRVDYCRFLQQDSTYTYQLLKLGTAAAKQLNLQTAVDVILLDLDLLNREGIALLKHLRQQWSSAQVAIIVVSAAEDVETVVEVMKGGAQDYLVKNKLTPERLHQAIHQALEPTQVARRLKLSQFPPQQQATQQITDITHQERQEIDLQELGTNLHRLFAVVDDVVLLLDRDGTYLKNISTNPKNFYRPAEEFLGKSLRDFFPTAQAEVFLNCIQQALETGQTQNCEYSLIIGDVERWFDAKCSPLTTETVLWVAQDVSEKAWLEAERKQAEAALKKSELTNHIIVETIPDLLIRMDRKGRYSNMAGGRAVRVKQPVTSATEPELYSVLSPELAEQRLYHANQAIESGTLQIYEQVFNFEGEQRYEEVRIAPLNDQEVLVIIRDITERKHAEIALRCLVESTAAVTGKDFFSTLAEQLMLALKVQYVLVTKLVGDHLQTLAYWKDGQSQTEITFALADAPCCASAIEHGQFYCPRGLQQRFPQYPLIQSLQAESYLGIPLTSADGQRIGNLCILDNKPMENIQWAEAFLRIFAMRAAAELERQYTTEALEQLNQELEVRVEERTAELRDNETKLSAIFNQVAVGMDLATLDGQFLKVNQKLCDLLGYTQEELLTKNIKELSHPEDINAEEEQRRQLYAGEIDSFSVEKRSLHKNGTTGWINLTVSLVRKLSGEPDYTIGVVKDISERVWLEAERKRAEDALRQSEEKFRQLAENIQSVFWISNANCSEIIYVSPAYETIWGRSCESLYASPASIVEAIYPEDKERVLTFFAQQSQGYDQEYRIVRGDGTLRWIRDRAFPIHNAQGEVYRLAGIAEDVTERKWAEETLNRQLATIEAAIDGIIILNTKGEYAYLNDAHVKLSGYDSAEEILGKPWQTLFSPTESSRFEQDVFPKLRETGAWRGEAIATRRDGSTFDKEISLTLTSNGELIGVCRDISDRKRLEAERRQTEHALQQSEEQFRAVFDYAPIAISLARIDNYQIFRVNAVHRQLFGYSDAELETMSFADFTYPDDLAQDIERVKQMLNGEIPGFQMEKRFIKKNGNVILTRMTVALIRNRDGSPLYSMAMMEDITEQKQSERLLQTQQAFLRRLIDTVPNLIFVKNWEGRFTLVNQATADTYNTTIENLVGKTDADFNPNTAEVEQFLAVDREVMNTLCTTVLEETITSSTGQQRYFQTIKSPLLSADGHSREILGVATDISDRKQIEEQLRQINEELAHSNMELARATRLKDEFLANMSHELRTPLNAVLGMTEGLLEEVFGELNSKQTKALRTIERSGSHLLALINDILDVAKIESGQVELELLPTAVTPLCHSSLAFIKQQALKKRIQVDIKLPSNLPSLFVDERRIRQVLINLLSNAVKFTPEEGHITLEVIREQQATDLNSQSQLPFKEKVCGREYLRIAITDTGIGIAPEHISKLFQPFIQIDSALNRKYQGTGLGLALVKHIIKLHGGQVGLTSEVGVGSCFTIDLPCTPFTPSEFK